MYQVYLILVICALSSPAFALQVIRENSMPHNNGIISSPVGLDGDVAPVLGVGSFDLGYLCANSHGKINMFSKIKPVHHSSMSEIPHNIFPTGIWVPEVNVGDSGSLSDPANEWKYSAPVGGDYSPYRLLDFDGYDHNAPAAFWTQQLPDSISYDREYEIEKSGVQSGGATNLGLNDLLGTTEIFAGIVVRAKSGTYKWYSTRASAARPLLLDLKVGSFWGEKDFEKEITVQLFLCNVYQTGWNSGFPTGMKFWLPVNVRSKYYESIGGTRPSLPSSNLELISSSPTSVKWSSSQNVNNVVVTVRSIYGVPAVSSLRLKVTSYLGYVSSLNFDFSENPSGSTQFKWISDGNDVYHTSPLNIYDTLVLNSSGNPIVGTTPRSANIQFLEKVVLSTITYYTSLGGGDTKSITLSN